MSDGGKKKRGGLFGKKDGLAEAIDELEAEKRQFDFVANALVGVFSQIDRAMTMMRVYPKNHPLVDSLIDQVVAKFDPIFENEDDVVVRVDAMQLTSEWGHVVHSQNLSEKKGFVWYTSYADGVIQYEFHKGLEGNELQKFLWLITNSSQGQISTDDDTVTLLWELGLQNIKYFAVEGFVDGGSLSDFDGRTEPEATGLIADTAEDPSKTSELTDLFSNLNTIHVDLFTRMQVEAQMKIPEVKMRDQDLEYAFLVNLKALERVVDEWDSSADLEYRLIEALLSVIRTAPATASAEQAGEIIAAVTHQLIDNEMWAGAVKVLKLLFARRSHFVDREFDPISGVVTELTDPRRLDALLNGFQKNGQEREALRELLLLLDHDGLQKQIILIFSDPKREIIGLKWLFDLLKDATNDANARNIYAPETVKKETYLNRVLGQLNEGENASWQPVARLLLKAIESKNIETLSSALKIEHSCWRDAQVAEKYIVAFTIHKDADLRKRALKILSKHHRKLFVKTIEESVMSKYFAGRSPGELRFLMRMFLDTVPDGKAELRKLLKTRGWGSESAREFTGIAAAVLLKSGDQESREIIERYCGSRLTHSSLKKTYSSLLIRHKVDNDG